MKNVLTILKREIRSYFLSPVAYAVIAGFLTLSGWFFFSLIGNFIRLKTMMMATGQVHSSISFNLNVFVLTPFFLNLSFLLMFIVPLMTMRLFAEERRDGTDELLLTSPIEVGELVAGKFLGALGFIMITLLITLLYPALLFIFGNPDPGPLLSEYMGLLLLSSSYVSIGMFTSTLTKNQIIASSSCFLILILLYVIAWPAQTMEGKVRDVLYYLSLREHYIRMAEGLFDTRDLVYFLSIIGIGIMLTIRSVESWRWR